MKALTATPLFFFTAIAAFAQPSSQEAIRLLAEDISKLEASGLIQTASYSKADYCAFSVSFKYPRDTPPGEEVMHLKLSDLNENDIDIEFNEDAEEWDLSVYCTNYEDRVLVTDVDDGNSYESILMVSDKSQEVLYRLKAVLKRAILACKSD